MKLPEPLRETWLQFEQHIDVFFDVCGPTLCDDNFDVIIGFSRGGTILSNILSCLIKDKFDFYKKQQHKLSVRNIPNGIYVKSKDPCFLINKTATSNELEDIREHLKNDLINFHSKYCNKDDKLNVLLVDDNLTGSTRLFEAKSFLESLLLEGDKLCNVKTLAYTRVKNIKRPKLDYQILKYPNNILFFTMPWHDIHVMPSHPIFNNNEEIGIEITFEFTKQKEIEFEMIIDEIENLYQDCRIVKHAEEDELGITDCATIRIGNIDLSLYNNEKSKRLEMRFIISKNYPPKYCLESDAFDINGKIIFDSNSEVIFEEGLCKNISSEITWKNLCIYCATLNCGKDLFDCLANKSDFSSVRVKNDLNDSNSKNIVDGINKWICSNTDLNLR